MDTQIKEDKVLEFKALTMTKKTLDQLRHVNPHEVEGDGTYEGKFIGWALTGITEVFVGKAHGTLVKVNRMDVWEWVAEYHNKVTMQKEADARGVGISTVVNLRADELRDRLPQIFIR